MNGFWFFMSVLAVVSGSLYCFREFMKVKFPPGPDPTAELVKRVEKLEQLAELRKLR